MIQSVQLVSDWSVWHNVPTSFYSFSYTLHVKNEVDSRDTFKNQQDHIIQRLLRVSQLCLTVFNLLSSQINKTAQINILNQINKLQLLITES